MDGFDENKKCDLWINQRKASLESTAKTLEQKISNLNELPPVDHLMALDILLNLPDGLMVKMDIATMAHGL